MSARTGPPERERPGDTNAGPIRKSGIAKPTNQEKPTAGSRRDRGDRQVRAAVHAAHHLLDRGLTPIFSTATAQAMWRCGYHRTATQVHVRSDYGLAG